MSGDQSNRSAPQAFEPFLRALCALDDTGAEAWFASHPHLLKDDPFVASASGEADSLAAFLDATPGLVHAGHPASGWTALHFAALSPLHRTSPDRAEGLVRAAALLVARGADPNAAIGTPDEVFGDSVRTPAYLAAVSGHEALLAQLLASDACASDPDAIEHCLNYDDRLGCLEVLRRAGADLSAPHPRSGMTPLYFLADHHEKSPWSGAPAWIVRSRARATAHMTWLLAHGADPARPSLAAQETPLHRLARSGYGRDEAGPFLGAGAPLEAARADGRTPYVVAVRAGNRALATFLRARGADPSRVRPLDELLGACFAGDGEAARTLLARDSSLRAQMAQLEPPEDRALVDRAVLEGPVAAFRCLAEAGFDLAAPTSGPGTALHVAAWNGRLEVVRALLALGAPVEARDARWRGTPLGWARHGREHHRRPPEDYAAVEETLVAAGASG